MERVTIPRLVFGETAVGAIKAELARLRVGRPMLVTDARLTDIGLAKRLVDALDSDSVLVFDAVHENPLFADADAAVVGYRAAQCDSVIALGGGSVIDTAKYAALIAANGGSVADYAGRPDAEFSGRVPLIVVPTTAGTGSEASPDAGIHPTARTPSVGMSSMALVPDAAILDPGLTVTLPPRLTAITAIDALSHCVEGFFSRRRSSLVDALLLDGIRRIRRALPAVLADGSDLAARGELMLAAFAGGVGIGMGLGPAHAIAIACSDQGFPHGVLSGIGLVCSLDLVASRDPRRAAEVAAALGLSSDASLSRAIAERMRSLDLPDSLSGLGYALPEIAPAAAAAHSSPFNLQAAYHPDAREYERMLKASLAAG